MNESISLLALFAVVWATAVPVTKTAETLMGIRDKVFDPEQKYDLTLRRHFYNHDWWDFFLTSCTT